MLLRKNIRAAGELEGARPASSQIIAIKNVRYGLFDEPGEIFREASASQKMWRYCCGHEKTVFFS